MGLMNSKLDTVPLVVNLRSLRSNLACLWRLALTNNAEALREVADQALWQINRPITRLNLWLTARCAAGRRVGKRRRHEEELARDLDRMDGEGPPPGPS